MGVWMEQQQRRAEGVVRGLQGDCGGGGTLQCRAEHVSGEVLGTGLSVYMSRMDAERMVQALGLRAADGIRGL